MTYCHKCGEEVPVETVYVCYNCCTRLKEFDFAALEQAEGTEDVSDFKQAMVFLLDSEIASIVSELPPEQAKDEKIPVNALPTDRWVNDIHFYAIGYGKGIMNTIMASAENANSDFRYESKDYQAVYRSIKRIVNEREEYVKTTIQPEDRERYERR